jgi:hypothetical protein
VGTNERETVVKRTAREFELSGAPPALHEDAGILASAFEALRFAGLNSTDCVFANPSFVDV